MALNSQIDKDSAINKGKNESQFTGLEPSIKGGDSGTKTSSSTGIKEGNSGKLFAGGE